MTAVGASLLLQSGRPRVEDESAPPVLSIGFRPFFLLATVMALLWIPLWLLVLSGHASVPGHGSGFSSTALHAHEMIFGFTVAVISGFLLTAGANWAGRATTNGKTLAGLVLLWLSGRLCLLSDRLPQSLIALVDISFLPVLALVLGVALVRAKSLRNLPFLLMLVGLSGANALMYAETSAEFRLLTGLERPMGAHIALRIITLMMLVMGGRVIPMFTRNATSDATIATRPSVERWALGSFLLAAGVELFLPNSSLSGLLLIAAGTLQLVRMRTWGSFRAQAPLLWVLHVSFFFVALSLVLDGWAVMGLLSKDVGRHLLTVGGMGGLCLGMMTRVSLGHSGRLLVAPAKMTGAFAFLFMAALVRSSSTLLPDFLRPSAIQVSGALWTLAFVLFLIFGLPIWLKPRVDARPPHSS